MEKPFKSIEEQINLMHKRGLSTDADTPGILMREGYYSIVNGYKDPFLDSDATRAAGDDRFAEGTSFNDVYNLFCFDRDLREVTFKHLMQVEAVVRTVCSYTFAEHHPEPSSYLIQGNFCTESEFEEFGLKNYIDNLLKLQSTLYSCVSRPRSEPVRHYKERHGHVPLWVLANSLTFGSVEHFFHLMKPAERRLVCKRIAEATGRLGGDNPYFDPKDARLSLGPIVKFRNICAHDDRLYCAKIGKRSPIVDYAAMIDLAEPYLCAEDYEKLLADVLLTIMAYDKRGSVARHVLEASGVGRIFDRASSATSKLLEFDEPDRPIWTRKVRRG